MQPPAAGGIPGAPGAGIPPFKIAGREINPQKVVSIFSRTFFCIGPVCLRSGIGPGVGVGCGVGVIKGPMLPLGGEAGNIDFLRQLPGGYQIMNVLRTIMRKFPGSKTGVGCGVGAGFGFGIGLAPAGAGGHMGGMNMGAMGGGMLGGGMMSGGMMGGGMTGGGMMGGGGVGGVPSGVSGGTSGGARVGGAAADGVGSAAATKALEERMDRLEEKLGKLEERVTLSLKVRELEERLSSVEKGGRKRR